MTQETMISTSETTGDTAREYFKNAGISYAKITARDIDLLVELVKEELNLYLDIGGEHARNIAMKVRKPLEKDVQFSEDGLQYALIRVDGSYFKKREAISFNSNGFIEIAKSFDGTNEVPYLNAFLKWCEIVSGSTTREPRV